MQKRYRRHVRGIGLVLLFLLYIVVPIPIRIAGGSAGFDVAFLIICGWIALGFWIGACLPWWRIVDAQAKWLAPTKRIRSALVLLPVLLMGGRAVYHSWPSVRAGGGRKGEGHGDGRWGWEYAVGKE